MLNDKERQHKKRYCAPVLCSSDLEMMRRSIEHFVRMGKPQTQEEPQSVQTEPPAPQSDAQSLQPEAQSLQPETQAVQPETQPLQTEAVTRRTRKTKTTPDAAPQKADEHVAPEAPVSASPEASVAPITLDHIRERAQVLSDKKDVQTLLALFAAHGVKRSKDLPKEEYAQFLAEVEALINE